jgi:hypothetical protein
MPVQQTFTLIPEARARAAATNNVAPRPMTSKQVKKAHKQANKQPKLSRAEQRKLELAEQERIRKELEKDRQAARARAARERKKQKEEAQKEAKRKSGKPLVDVRPSQDTIARFVRGNGTGKKRDRSGVEIAQKPAPLAPVSEEPEEHTKDNDESESDKDQAIDTSDRKMGESTDHNDLKTCQPEQRLPAIRSSQRLSQRSRQDYSEGGLSQQRKKSRISAHNASSQSAIQIRNMKATSPVSHGQRPANYETVTAADEPSTDLNSEHLCAPAHNPGLDHTEEPEAMQDAEILQPFLSDEFSDLDTMGVLSQRSGFSNERTIHGEQSPSCGAELPKNDDQTGKQLGASESFRMDPDDLLDDDSLLQLEEAIGGGAALPAVRVGELKQCSKAPISTDPNTHAPKAEAKQDSQSSLDFDMLDNMNAIFEELTSCTSPLRPETMTTNDVPGSRLPGPKPCSEDATSPKARQQRQMRRVISFADEDLDDDTLLCLAEAETNLIDKVSCATKQDTATTIMNPHPPRILRQPTTHERDLGLAPDVRPTKSFVPLSTQAILSDVDDFFPTPSQQARELDDMSASLPISQLSGNALSGDKGRSLSVDTEATTSPQLQNRFFTASGSNELLSLALQRSRRSAALEEIRQKERQRHEAGLLEQARHRTARAPLAQNRRAPPTHHWQDKVPATALPLKKPCATETPPPRLRSMPCRLSLTSPRVYVMAPPPPSNLESTLLAVKVPLDASQPGKNKSKMISDDKENLAAPKFASSDHNGNNHGPPPPASQESEYGGDWMDDAFSDFAV